MSFRTATVVVVLFCRRHPMQSAKALIALCFRSVRPSVRPPVRHVRSSVCFVHSFVQTDLVTTLSHEWLEQSRWNLQGIFPSPQGPVTNWLDFGGQRSRSHQAVANASTSTLGRRRSKSSSFSGHGLHGLTSQMTTFEHCFNDRSLWRPRRLKISWSGELWPHCRRVDVQVLCSCPGLRLSQALYDVTRTCRLSLGVIVTSLLRANASDVAMTFLRDTYVSLNQHGQYFHKMAALFFSRQD